MKVGMLECDHVKGSFLRAYGDYRDMFEKLLPEITFQHYDVYNEQFPQSALECDAYLVTGSKHSVYEDIPWIHQLKAFVREIQQHKRYYVGICFGHQMLAEALGGKVEKSASGWCVGVHTFQIIAQEKWMTPYQNEFNLLMSCQDQVLKMPYGSTLLAHSKECPFGMFKVGDRMVGIQGHPEFEKGYDRALIESRIDTIGPMKANEGIQSLVLDHDGPVFMVWLMNYIAG
jgi:GMP synthase-like glutamine amidotransferase